MEEHDGDLRKKDGKDKAEQTEVQRDLVLLVYLEHLELVWEQKWSLRSCLSEAVSSVKLMMGEVVQEMKDYLDLAQKRLEEDYRLGQRCSVEKRKKQYGKWGWTKAVHMTSPLQTGQDLAQNLVSVAGDRCEESGSFRDELVVAGSCRQHEKRGWEFQA